MSCIASEQEIISHLPKGALKKGPSEIIEGDINDIVKLERGGCLIKTQIGNIQLGMPPETVKDSLNLGLVVPTYYILPTTRFDRKFGLNVSEFEFPAYFNFFILRKKITLICDKEGKKAIEQIFQETLLGPKLSNIVADEFHQAYDPDRKPNFAKEMKFFAKNPFNSEQPLSIDLLISFVLFDESNSVVLENKVQIIREENAFCILENGKLIAKMKDNVKIRDKRYSDFLNDKRMFVQHGFSSKESYGDLPASSKEAQEVTEFFNPPKFGVTVLGASHGFDPKGSTSGYVLWINKRGIMIDPPPFSSYILKKNGIPHNLIDKVIITHCHADHDAGSFQKVLFASQVEIMTTPTIMGSFMRKYSAITGYSQEELRQLFVYRPVIIGHHTNVLGANLRFFYSLHTIPCIGFEVFYGSKSLYFSGDTFYHPEKLSEMYQAGVLSKSRFESLSDIFWRKYDIILHEAGVPPIHTPIVLYFGSFSRVLF